jgi:PadR family transcriptional regulator, regulatory protein AphA
MILMSLSAAILGFLSLEPMTGYTLRQRFEGSVGSFWTVTQSQIYRELYALERDELVQFRVREQQGRPAQKIYSLTTSGRAFLRSWLEQPVEPLQLRHPMLLKFVFAADLEPELLDSQLARYAKALQVKREEYRRRSGAEEIFSLARSAYEAELWHLSLEHGIAWCEAELDWIKRARRRLGESQKKMGTRTGKGAGMRSRRG